MGKDNEDLGWLEERRAIVEAVRSRRVTALEVMAQLGVSASVFGGWCRAEQRRCEKGRREAPVVRPTARSGFARVSLVGPRAATPVADLVLAGGRRLRLRAGFDVDEVVRLVKALETC